MISHPSPAGRRIAARVAAGRRLPPGRATSLALSAVAHVALVCGAFVGHRGPASAPPSPVAFAVERSMLSHEAAAAAPPRADEVLVEVETTPEEPVVDPTLAPPPETIDPPPPPERIPSEPRHAEDSRLRQCAKTRLGPEPPPEPVVAVTLPIEAPPAPAVSTPQVARPDVPVAIPGQNPAPEYPALARRRSIEGTVLVRIDFDAGGGAANCTVVASSGCTSLDFAALAAARRWRFTNGPGSVEVPFVFQIRG